MTATAADALRMLAPDSPDTWPAGILAAADMRERLAKAATPGPYSHSGRWVWATGRPDAVFHVDGDPPDAEHIAAEGNPAHSLAAVRHWRGTVRRHGRDCSLSTVSQTCVTCGKWSGWPCPDLTEVADEVRAHLGGAA